MVTFNATPFGGDCVIQCGMADNALIRRANFNRLYPDDKFGPADLIQRFGRTSSFWSDLRAGRKSFGEKLARSLEDAGQLAPGSLDAEQGAKKMPLSHDLLAHLESLSEDDQRKAEALLRIHLGLTTANGKRSGAGS